MKTESPLIAIRARLVGVIFDGDVYRSFGVFLLFCAVVVPAFGQTSVLTQHNDNARTGQNTSETILNTSNVNVNQFGKLFAMPSDGQVYAQPLYVPGVTINGGVHNLVILATENDSVYAYDADSSGAPLWKASMVDAGAGAGETALNSATTTGCTDLQPQVGITSTPVIDPTSKTVYVEAKSTDGFNYFHRLHALDLLTGNEKTPGPVVIAGTVSGTGDGSSPNGQLVFDNLSQMNRPGLLLMNDTIYLAYASHCDFGPYHGWLFAYDAATFTQKSVYVTTPNGGLGGFWMSGAGVAADASGNIFIASGNGDFDTTNVPATETGDTLLKLGTTNQILTQLDYFTPGDQAFMQGNDFDLGSGGVLLLPDQPGSFPHILVEAGKEGRVYVVNRDQMTTNNSHYCSGCTSDPEIIEESGSSTVGVSGQVGGMYNIAAYWNNTLYFWGVSDVLKSIPITNGLPDFTHVTGSTPQIGFPGAGVSVSSNGTTPGSAIVWAIDGTQYGSPGPGPGPAVLYAYDATNVPTMLYSSAQNATRDAAGNAVKFTVPTVANGKVYVGTSTEVDVYGLVGVNPVPNISSITPSSATAGGPAFPLTVNGTGFITGATVNFGSNPAITPSSVTSTQIVATIPAADITTAGTVNVTVTNPAAGGTSNAQIFTINNPAPTETSISPTTATAGGAAFTLTVNGTGFVSTSVLKFNGAAKTTTFVSATQLTAAITAADIATAGTASVTVTNAVPGGGTSGTLSFTINGSALTLTSIAPASTTVGGATFTLTLTGTGFVTGATVNFGSSPAITSSFVTSTQIVATIPAGDITTAGTLNVTVTNPVPGGGMSNAQVFTVTNPAPTEISIAPPSATAGGAALTLTVNGTDFISTSVVKFNGVNKTTTFISSTQLTAGITAADITTAGSANVTVTNPAPGGGTTASIPFTISNPNLIITSLSPTSATAGGAAFTLTVSGSGFVNGATVNFGSNPAIAPSSGTSTQIVATIPAADISTGGTARVTVTNPPPGGGISSAQTFTISNPAPTAASISPTSATAGGAAFTLTVNGTGFVSTSVVKLNGAAKATTFISAAQLAVAITGADIATAGTASVTVTNPAPGGGTSANLQFTISSPNIAITSLLPSSATAGGTAFTLTVNGSGFVSGSAVMFNGASKATTFINGTQLTAAIAATDIATAGTVNVTVTNPAPGGGTSNAQTFTINNPAPTVASLSPNIATAGGAAFTLTVNGTGFVSTSVVTFNEAAKTTTFISRSQLAAAITAADIAAVGTANVAVTNPGPGGSTSANVQFTINNPNVAISSLSPNNATAGGAAFTLTVNGSGFVRESVVRFNGVAKTTTFTSATQLSAAITAAEIVTAGTVNVTVTNPPPGGTSSAASFTINNPAPTVSSLSPSTVVAGSAAFTLTLNGTSFVNGASVQFNGLSRATTFVSTTQITAAILVSDVATAGTANVTVTNPAPTTNPSTPQVFTISSSGNPVPTISSLGATHAPGGAALTLAVNGTNFEAKSVVNFNGKQETTTFVSATKLSAAIPASDLAIVGNMNVTVTNPAPVGGTSAASPFTVDGYTISGSSGASLSPGQPAMIQITATPTANGFPNSISFSVSGLPAGSTASFNPAMLTPNGNATTTTLTITDAASAVSRRSASIDVPGSRLLPPMLAIWIAALLGWLYLRLQVRTIPLMKRYATLALVALILLTGSILSGCALPVTSSPSTSTSQLTVTATSGTLTQTFGITLQVTR